MIEAMKQALTALENNRQTHHYCEDTWYSCPKHEEGCANDSEGDECNCGADKANIEIDAAITSLRQAIREHAMYEVQRLGQEIEQEPVAEARFDGTLHWLEPYGIGLHRFQGPLYIHQPQRTWVGLTDEEIDGCDWGQSERDFARAIEAKLKEKNND